MKNPIVSAGLQRLAPAALAAALAACSSGAAGLTPANGAAAGAAGARAATIIVQSASPELTGDVRSGFVFPKCAAVETVDVPAANPATLTSDDPQLAVVRTSTANRFELRPRGIPDGNSVAHLTAAVGSRSVTATVTFSGAICGHFSEYIIPTGGSGPVTIAAGPDHALWFTEINAAKIGRITTGGVISETGVITAAGKPFSIAAGPDGAMWFTENNANKIGRVSMTKALSEYNIPTANSAPNGITAGADKVSVWFVEGSGNNVGVINTSTKHITEYRIPTAGSGAYSISRGPGTLMAFTEYYASKIGYVTSTGHVTDVAVSNAPGPLGIALGGSTLWFTDNSYGAIGRKNATWGYFPTPTKSSYPNMIADGPDGAMWFTEGNTSKIGRITDTATGTPTITELTIPTANAGAFGITTGPDGAIWFTESYQNKIGRIQ